VHVQTQHYFFICRHNFDVVKKSLLVYNTLATGKELVMAAETAKALATHPQKRAVAAQNTQKTAIIPHFTFS
jgi:hypothetical protein